MQRDEISLKKTHEKHEEDAILELCLQIIHLKRRIQTLLIYGNVHIYVVKEKGSFALVAISLVEFRSFSLNTVDN